MSHCFLHCSVMCWYYKSKDLSCFRKIKHNTEEHLKTIKMKREDRKIVFFF